MLNKTNYFSNGSQGLTYIANPRNFTGDAYADRVDLALSILDLTKKIIYAYIVDEPKPDNIEEDEFDVFTEEELRQLLYIDDIEKIHWPSVNSFKDEICLNAFFDSRNCDELYITNIERFKNIVLSIKSRVDYGQDVNFDADYKEQMLRLLANLNYCTMVVLGLFKYGLDQVYLFMRDYAINKNLNIGEMYTDMYEYYKDNRPDLDLFDKYPELALELEKVVSSDVLFDLANLSSEISRQDLEEIIAGKIIVDDDYIETLKIKRFEKFQQGLQGDGE